MFNRAQNKTFNKLVSFSASQAVRAEGNDVAVFKAERSLDGALLECGFTQNIQKDKFNNFYGHSMWWHEASQLLVLRGNCDEWTIATESYVLTASSMAQPA